MAAASMYVYREIHPSLSKVYTQVDFSKVPTAPHRPPPGARPSTGSTAARSSVTYRVDERIVGKSASHATGTTNGIAGDLALDLGHASAARTGKIVVDLEQLHSDNRLRDARIREDFLESHEHPLATLAPGAFAGLPATVEDGKSYRFTFVAPLTVKDVTAPTTWSVSRSRRRHDAHGDRHHDGEDVDLPRRPDPAGRAPQHIRRRHAHDAAHCGGRGAVQDPDGDGRSAGVRSAGVRSVVQARHRADPLRRLRLVPPAG